MLLALRPVLVARLVGQSSEDDIVGSFAVQLDFAWKHVLKENSVRASCAPQLADANCGVGTHELFLITLIILC